MLGVPTFVLTLIVLVVVIVGVAIAWLTVGRNEVPRTAPTKVSVFTRAARADLYGDALNEGLLMRPGDQFVTGLVRFDDNGVDGVVNGTGGRVRWHVQHLPPGADRLRAVLRVVRPRWCGARRAGPAGGEPGMNVSQNSDLMVVSQ